VILSQGLLLLALVQDPVACIIGQGCTHYTWDCADADCNGQTDVNDLMILLDNWGYVGLGCCAGDFNCDGKRTNLDLLIWLDDFAEGCGA